MWPERSFESRDTGPVALRLESVTKTYESGSQLVHAVRDLSVSLRRGSFTAVMGPSGSGKSTLLHCAAGLDRPTSGRVWIGDTEVSRLRERPRTEFRREHVGFVFQAFNLLQALTVAENVTLPALLAGRSVAPEAIADVLTGIGLLELSDRRPAELSGGQQQRVAIARALIGRPDVVFADEPTGALDLRSGREVLTLFRAAVSDLGHTVVMVTHDPVAASHADSVMFLADGRVVGDLDGGSPSEIAAEITRLTEPAA